VVGLAAFATAVTEYLLEVALGPDAEYAPHQASFQ
jgi:hypothetical protein